MWKSRIPVPRFTATKAEIATSLKCQDQSEIEHKEGYRSPETQDPGEVDSRCYNQNATHGHFETGGPTSAGQDQHLDHK